MGIYIQLLYMEVFIYPWPISDVRLANMCIIIERMEAETKWLPFRSSKCIFLNESAWILIKMSLKFVAKGPINNIPALVQIMGWHQPGGKPLSEQMVAIDAYIASLGLNGQIINISTQDLYEGKLSHFCFSSTYSVTSYSKIFQQMHNMYISQH